MLTPRPMDARFAVMPHLSKVALLCLAALALCGCREPVLTARPEDEANSALATLSRSGVAARKVDIGRGQFSVLVARGDLKPALEILSAAGLPRTAEPSIADLFSDPGLISNGTEQRIRYHNALAGELSASLRRVPCVREARVHLALPPEQARRLDRSPASPIEASVLLILEPDATGDEQSRSEEARRLVAGAVVGLDSEAVSVVVTRAPSLPARPAPRQLEIHPAMLATGVGALMSGLVLAFLLVLRRKRNLAGAM